MQKIKCAVIGVGYLGRFHAQKYQQLANATLIAVCDLNKEACQAVSKELDVPGYNDYKALFGHVDAVSIAATTRAHYAIARDCLSAGLHVLLEKPITATVEEANELIAMSKAYNRKLQVGHLERFNSAYLALDRHLKKPFFIESRRLSPFNPRGADVNVVLDLMIHDLDIIQTIVKSPIKHIEAQGATLLSSSIDMANARITFENHCVANITASRVNLKTERKMHFFQKNNYISVDYHEKQVCCFQRDKENDISDIPNLACQQLILEKNDALLDEITAFLNCIEENKSPLVTAENGRDALMTATQITTLIEAHLAKNHVYL